MPFNRPTLKDIIARIVSDIETRLNIKLLIHSILRIVATAYAGAVHLLHGHVEWASKQLFIDTADDENVEKRAAEYGLTRIAAAYATGNVTLTGTNGAIIYAGTEFQDQNGVRFASDSDVVIASGTATTVVTAVNAGSSGNVAAGSTLTLVVPIAGVMSQAIVAVNGISAGVDAETTASLVARTLDRMQQPPHGGASFDYVTWAKEVAGVTRAYVYPTQFGIGTVGVAILADQLPGGPVAPTQLIDDVQDYIDSVRPVTADVTVWTPIAEPMAVSIHISPDNATIRAAVTASLADLLRREAEPGKTILLSKIREAVSVAAGENDNTVTVPSANFTVAANKIATLGVITWT